MIDKSGLNLIIVTRPDCYKCQEIKEVAEKDGIPVQIIQFNEGGAFLLSKTNFVPNMLPAVIAYKDGMVIHRWCGLSQFLEAWVCEDEIGL